MVFFPFLHLLFFHFFHLYRIGIGSCMRWWYSALAVRNAQVYYACITRRYPIDLLTEYNTQLLNERVCGSYIEYFEHFNDNHDMIAHRFRSFWTMFLLSSICHFSHWMNFAFGWLNGLISLISNNISRSAIFKYSECNEGTTFFYLFISDAFHVLGNNSFYFTFIHSFFSSSDVIMRKQSGKILCLLSYSTLFFFWFPFLNEKFH